MTAALLYQPAPKSGIWIALGLAALLHLGAIAVAEFRPVEAITATADPGIDVIPVTDPLPEAPDPTEEPLPPPPVPVNDDTFPEEKPAPFVRKTIVQAKPLVRATGPARRVEFPTSARVLALHAPRPEYPYEARRQRLTGSGVALLTIDPGSGAVLEVAMAQSTGSSVLDNAAVSGLRLWRFRAGTAAKIRVPITYTLTGAAY